jgi:tripartite-type tricarboxylate transporter receptor subunit TctC
MRSGIQGNPIARRQTRLRFVLLIAATIGGCPLAAWAQTSGSGSTPAYPNKPVRYIVPFGAGAAPDTVARILTDKLTRLWNQQVIVENRVGVAGTLGAAFVAKSPPDGYTLLQCNVASTATSPLLYKSTPYDPLRDFASITRIGTTPNILTAHPSVPIRSMQEFIQYAKTNPRTLTYSAGLAGESPQLSIEFLKLVTKIDVAHIPYKVAAQGISDTIGGQIPFNSSNLPSVVQHVQGGRLRGLGVTSGKRAQQLPNVPTMQESGVMNYEVTSWYGLCAPAGTPTPVTDKLYSDYTSVLRTPEIQQRLDDLGVTTAPMTATEFEQFIRAEITRWAKVIKEAGIPQQ